MHYPPALLPRSTLSRGQDAESVALHLASATAACALPYFEVLGEAVSAAVVGVAARTAGVVPSVD